MVVGMAGLTKKFHRLVPTALILVLAGPLVSLYDFQLFGIAHADTQTWAKSYGGSEQESGSSVQPTSDGGYVVAGISDTFDAGAFDVWILKLDFVGNIEWEKTYGGTDFEEARAIRETSDGGYIIAGGTDSFGPESQSAWILKLDSDGNVEWEKAYGGTDLEDGGSIQQTTDGGYVMIGSTDSFGPSVLPDVWIIKLDSAGNIDWEKAYGGDGTDYASSIVQTSDGGYVATGRTESFGDLFSADTWVLKLDSDGEINDCGADFIKETIATVTDTDSTPRVISQDIEDVDSTVEDTAATVQDSSALVRSQCGDYEFLLLENGSVPSDGIVDWGDEIVGVATTTDESVEQVEFRWLNPSGEVVRQVTSDISGVTQDAFSPNEGGQWSVEADFLNGIVIKRTFEIGFFVVPESPIGAVAMIMASAGTLAAFLFFRSRKGPGNI